LGSDEKDDFYIEPSIADGGITEMKVKNEEQEGKIVSLEAELQKEKKQREKLESVLKQLQYDLKAEN